MKRIKVLSAVTAAAIVTGVAGAAVAAEPNTRVPEGATWSQHYFPSADDSGAELHADVLLPDDLPKGGKVPVILSVGPYFGHAGQMKDEGHKTPGPSERFRPFVDGAGLMERGYAFVMVDSRGFGGSTGCLDFAGPGEQADVRAAIDWAASQPWSTGAVGMFGKSYDAITGLIGAGLNQDPLKAVVAQEPIWNPVNSPHTNGIPRVHMLSVSQVYNSIASLPGMTNDDKKYQANAAYEATNPHCLDENLAGYLIDDPESAHWRARDLPALAKGSDTPLFVTQGFIEDNTKPEDMDEFLAGHRGPTRAWLGQWNHVQGHEKTEDGQLKMGRDGWFTEVMSFYDEHLKGIEPKTEFPPYAVQDSNGKWRAQDTWPVVDRTATLSLGGGSYVDDGGADARKALDDAGLTEPPVPPNPNPDPEEGAGALEPVIPKNLAAVQLKRLQEGRTTSAVYKFSKPVAQATRLTGTPQVSLAARGTGNVMVKLYDVGPGGQAVIINENVSAVRAGRTTFDLKSTDWTLAAGHVLGVEIGTLQTGSWLDKPSRETIRVRDARLKLALDDPAGDVATEGQPSPFQALYLKRHQVNLTAALPASFTIPAP
ncbi:CocE/NonD family hydrolase [Actinoplanes bogorensis]|uniref:CocE/NonD family hydrolase n=1 Tax=Paractinoplanes bogorensis TaxID=1610840 RepID=A0ABS5YKT0_9ACTN|nr:CocE/NonD family hydrolase [Actinoplanes bogorensis]MBU2663998.1 CocE/NonD family hydrolase [Actinoplanes bogorensis]